MKNLPPKIIINRVLSFFLLIFIGQTTNSPIVAQDKSNSESKTKILASAKSPQKKNVCLVLDFEDKSLGKKKHEIGKQAAILVAHKFGETGGCQVIERAQISSILSEQNLSFDSENIEARAAKIGRILSADVVLVGTIEEFKVEERRATLFFGRKTTFTAKIGFVVRLINVQTGDVVDSIAVEGIAAEKNASLNSANATTVEDEDLKIRLFAAAVNDAADKTITKFESYIKDKTAPGKNPNLPSIKSKNSGVLFSRKNKLPINGIKTDSNGKVVQVAESSVYVSGLKNIEVGQILIVRRVSREVPDPDTGEVLTVETQRIAEIEVTEIREKVVVAKIVSGSEIKPRDLVVNNSVQSANTTANLPAAEAELWEFIKNSTDEKDFKEFLTEFPNGVFAASARVKLQYLLTSRGSEIVNLNADYSVNEEKLSRHPNIETPNEVPIGNEFAVNVSLTQEKLTENTQIRKTGTKAKSKSANELSLSLPANIEKKWEIEVILTAPGFSFKDGKNSETITLPLDGDSTDATFNLTAKLSESEESETKTRLFATFRHDGAFLAKVEREITIKKNAFGAQKNFSTEQRKKSVAAPLPAASARNLIAGRAQAAVAVKTDSSDEPEKSAQSIGFSIKQEQPDLTILVQEKAFPGQRENSYMQISSPYFKGVREGFYAWDEKFNEWLVKNFRAFSGARGRGSELVGGAETTRETLRGFGRDLYDRQPEVFKKTLWELQDKPGIKIKTILIITNNPLTPWELIYPTEKNRTLPNEFLGLEYNIGRLHNKNGATVGDFQPQTSRVSGITVIAPQYQGAADLKAVVTEVNNLKSLNLFAKYDGLEQQSGQIEKLRILFAALPPRIIHFAGHGVVRRNGSQVETAAIKLENGQELDSTAWQGMLDRRNQNQPLFFFNACEVGQSDLVAGFVDGWAAKVLEAGASGYIGALWSIGDKSAAEFSSGFYRELESELKAKGRASVPDILRRVRQSFLKNNDPSFMSYVFYGDPNLFLTEGAAIK